MLPGKKKKILVLIDWFHPGYKAGGPIRSSLHFVQQMKDEYDVAVLTTDRDLHARTPYENVTAGQWVSFSPGIEIFYCSPQDLSWKFILRQIKMVKPDFIYLNSMYSKYFTVYPLLMLRLGLVRQKIVLSPRGMLKASALQFSKTKKKIFLSVLRAARVQRFVRFHATDETEQQDIRRHFGQSAVVTMAPNFAGRVDEYPGTAEKNKGELKIIFVGRLHPIKNLDLLLQWLPEVSGNISLTVVGSEEDKNYVSHCKSLVQKFPERIQVQFTGEVPNNRLPAVLKQQHIFALPTRGENFGHAIFEALAAGKPVLISSQTPWRNLSPAKAGWDIDLPQPGLFVQSLQQAVDFDQQQYNEWSEGAWRLAVQASQQRNLKDLYFNLFS
jgi:glycosyltransferase involved in cell wall biosynthesis